MNRIKRFVSAFLVVAMTICFVSILPTTAVVNDPIEYVYSDEYRFVEAFDLMPVCNYDDFQPEKPLTRGEFARILCALCGANASSGNNSFVDISGHEYEEYINTVEQLGMMVGTDKYTFMPNREITINEVVKTLLVMMGYEAHAKTKGGYPVGYLSVAERLGVLDGVKTDRVSTATRGDIARLIYNLRDVQLMSIVVIKNDSMQYLPSEKDTFLTYYLGVDYIKGLLVDNGISGLYGESVCGENRITISDIDFEVDSILETRTMLGQYVEAYYTVRDDGGIERIRYIQLDNEMYEDVKTFDINDFVALKGRRISYDNGKKIVDISLCDEVSIIYNGKYEKIITEEMFDYDYGTVMYVPEYKGNNDVLIIENFVTWYIEAVDRELEIVRTMESNRKIDGSYQLQLKEDEIGKTIFIEDGYGMPGTINDITQYSVLDISKNDEVMFIKVAPLESADKVVKNISTKQDETYVLFTDGEKARVLPEYAKTDDFNTVNNGAVYYVYKNSFGDIAALVLAENAGLQYGYMLGVGIEGPFGDVRRIRILDKNDTFQVYEVAEKINWSDTMNNTGRYAFTDVIDTLRVYGEGIINYRLNDENQVSLIYLPVTSDANRKNGRLGLVFDGEAGYYESTRRSLGRDILVNSSASAIPIFKVYESAEDDEDKYKSGTAALYAISNSENGVTTKAYNYEPNSKYAEFIVQTHTGSLVASPTTANDVLVIKDMDTLTMYKDELCYEILCGTPNGQEKTIYVKEEDVSEIEDTMGSTTDTYTLKNGDIILCRMSAADNAVPEKIFLWWRSDMDAVYENGRRGGIPGNLGYYDATKISISNPYIFGGGDGRGDWTAQYRCMFGYVYNVDSKGGVYVSTQNLNAQAYDSSLDGWGSDNGGLTPHTYHPIIPHYGNYTLVTYKDGEVIVRAARLSDIRSYLRDGNECSRVLFMTNYGRVDTTIIINGEME